MSGRCRLNDFLLVSSSSISTTCPGLGKQGAGQADTSLFREVWTLAHTSLDSAHDASSQYAYMERILTFLVRHMRRKPWWWYTPRIYCCAHGALERSPPPTGPHVSDAVEMHASWRLLQGAKTKTDEARNRSGQTGKFGARAHIQRPTRAHTDPRTHTRAYTHTHTHPHTPAHTHTHPRTRTRAHARTHTHTHTHTHTRARDMCEMQTNKQTKRQRKQVISFHVFFLLRIALPVHMRVSTR